MSSTTVSVEASARAKARPEPPDLAELDEGFPVASCRDEVLADNPDEPTRGLRLVDQLLRDRDGLNRRIRAGSDLSGVARTMLITIIVSAAAAGAAMGFYRGGIQIAYSALKLPVVLLLTAGLCTPAFSALRSVVLGDSDLRRDLALVLSSLALASLIAAGLAPLMVLAALGDTGYHAMIMLVFGSWSAGAAAGLWFFVRGVEGPQTGRRAFVGALFMLAVLAVGAQMSWTLRPYVVRPKTEEIPFVRSVEGSFLEAVALSAASSLEIYFRSSADDARPFGDAWEARER